VEVRRRGPRRARAMGLLKGDRGEGPGKGREGVEGASKLHEGGAV